MTYPVLKMLGIAHKASPTLQNEVTWSALNNTLAEATDSSERRGVAGPWNDYFLSILNRRKFHQLFGIASVLDTRALAEAT